MRYIFGAWILILLIELFSFYNAVHNPYDIAELIFHVTLIIVTLVVGVTGILVSSKKNDHE